MAGKVTAEELARVKEAAAKYTDESKKAFVDAGWGKSNVWLLQTKSSWTSSGWMWTSWSWAGSSSGGTSSWLTNKGDIYGDVSKKATTNQAMDFSSYSGDKTLSSANALFGKDAEAKEKASSWFITNRNNTIAYELQNKWTIGEQDIRNYLNQYDSFKNADQLDRDNTVNAIKTRLSEISKSGWAGAGMGDWTITDTTTTEGVWPNGEKIEDTTKTTEDISKDGYYFDKWTWEYVKIYWYDDLSKDYRDLIDRMSEQDRKYLSNMWASGMQEQVRTYLDAMRSKDQAEAIQEKNKELYDINRAKSLIEAEQTLRHSQEQYDNLKQNWQYLGNMGMPWTSAVKIEAIWDALKEAQTTLWEIQQLTKLSLDAQEKQWEAQVLQYNQQIDNLMYNLNWQVGSEVQAALSKFTTAELEGQLDTIDGITAFRKELLDDLDANISGLTSASLQQMQYITEQYQDIANKLYDYQQNAQKVNQEMSQVKGYYVDGNGKAILNAKGETIQVPKQAPLDPVYDKETGKLIVFGYDENGNIVANVQNILGANDYYSNSIYSSVGWSGGYLDIPRNVNGFTDNIGADTNNFGNFTSMVEGAIGMYHSPNGRDYAVFANAQDGYNALVKDLNNKKNWNTKTWLNANSTIEQLMWTWVNGSWSVDPSNYYAQAFYKATGLQPGTKIGSVDAETLAKWIMAGEGTLAAYDKWGVDLSRYASQNAAGMDGGNKYNQVLVDMFKKDSLTAEDWKTIESFGLSRAQFGNLKEDYFLHQQDEKTNGILDRLWKLIAEYPWRLDLIAASGDGTVAGFSKLTNTDLANYINDLNYIKGNLTFSALSDAKKWGATFGSMTEWEWSRIDNFATSLDVYSSKDKFISDLAEIYNSYAKKALWREFTADELAQMYGVQSKKDGWVFANANNKYLGGAGTTTWMWNNWQSELNQAWVR